MLANQKALWIAIALCLSTWAQAQTRSDLNSLNSPFKLPPLSYALNALEPVIDQETMSLHHGKHHQAYVDKLNEALGDNKLSLLEILKRTREFPASVRNNGGGHWNHAFFWTVMSPTAKSGTPGKKLEADLIKNFGSVENFKTEFEKQATSLFGSGWVWLIRTSDGRLKITTTTNQDNPLMDVATEPGQPILALDVWEHAYYVSYRNKRADYVKNFWKVVNWSQVAKYHAEK
ncbi:MAG TPA: superoxide dismutase [Pseudobdellovibrionaceae bacterium]|nr:superoxide dismutase [Pseudobdellovibrionaceae bacterium]